MKRHAIAAFAVGTFAFAGAAYADCDRSAPDAVIAVPRGQAVRVMYSRPGPENNWVEVCTRASPGEPWLMQTGEFANATDWYLLWQRGAQSADDQLNFLGTHFGPSDLLQPWRGVRRTPTPTGFTIAFYEASPDQPNTIVEVCIQADLARCPPH